MNKELDNAMIGNETIIEPQTQIGFRYHPQCGSTTVGSHGMIRSGAIIYGDVQLGSYCQIGHHAVIRAKVSAGNYFALGNQSTIEGLVQICDGVRIMSHVYIPSRTKIGNHVFIGPGSILLNDKFPGRLKTMPKPHGPSIEDEVVIGGNCTILPGICIGKQSFIAAGTVVTKNIPPHSLVLGNPGRIKPLTKKYDIPNNRELTQQPIDLWHPLMPNIHDIE